MEFQKYLNGFELFYPNSRVISDKFTHDGEYVETNIIVKFTDTQFAFFHSKDHIDGRSDYVMLEGKYTKPQFTFYNFTAYSDDKPLNYDEFMTPFNLFTHLDFPFELLFEEFKVDYNRANLEATVKKLFYVDPNFNKAFSVDELMKIKNWFKYMA